MLQHRGRFSKKITLLVFFFYVGKVGIYLISLKLLTKKGFWSFQLKLSGISLSVSDIRLSVSTQFVQPHSELGLLFALFKICWGMPFIDFCNWFLLQLFQNPGYVIFPCSLFLLDAPTRKNCKPIDQRTLYHLAKSDGSKDCAWGSLLCHCMLKS